MESMEIRVPNVNTMPPFAVQRLWESVLLPAFGAMPYGARERRTTE